MNINYQIVSNRWEFNNVETFQSPEIFQNFKV